MAKKKEDDYYISADYILERKTEFVSFSPSVDVVLGGGIRDGCFVVLGGSPGLGKTSYGLKIIANAQQQGRVGVYVNVEERLEANLLHAVEGLDLSPEKFKLITSTPGDILTAEDYLQRTDKILTEIPKAVVLLDSLSDLTTAEERTKEYGSGYNVAARKLESEFAKRIAPVLSVNRGILIGIAHTSTSMGYTGASDKVSRETDYKANLKLRCSKAQPYEITSGDKIIGHRIQWEVLKNSYGPPKVKAISHLRYGVGPDYVYDVVTSAVDLSVIEKSGAWFKVPGQEKQFQGLEKVYEFLKENRSVYNNICATIKELLS